MPSYRLLVARMREIFELSKKHSTNESLTALFRIQTKTVNTQYREFNDVYIQIVSNATDAETTALENTRKEVDTFYYSILEKLEEITPPARDTPVSRFSPTPSSDVSADKLNVRLPKLSLATFDGSYRSWQPFIDLFDSIVH